MKYIHLNCLKHWLNTNTFILYDNKEFSKTFIFKEGEIKCELCKTQLPNFIRHKGKIYEITDFGFLFKNYAIFESLSTDEKGNKLFYMISLDYDNKILSVGRGQNCSLILNDNSISRNQCIFRYSNKKLFIEDFGSKFGTLILCQVEAIKLVEDLGLYLQIGTSFIKCKLKKSYSLFECCHIYETYNFDYYYKQNIIKIEDFHKMTIKTEVDFEDDNNYSKEEGKNKNILIESNNEINKLKKNKIKIMGEDNFVSNFDIYCPHLKLNTISECFDENNIKVNKSDNESKKNLIDNNNSKMQ